MVNAFFRTGVRAGVLMLGLAALAGCSVPIAAPVSPTAVQSRLSPAQAARNFAEVVARTEPVAERICRAETRGVDCDFEIVVVGDVQAPPNAFQTLSEEGRPQIGFTIALIADARNADELAFILGHEAAHHIAGHIPRSRETAQAGAVILGGLASLGGGDASTVEAAARLGASLGARRFSKDFELEADALGTVIAARAGYDPVRGAAYFSRIPDPGNRFMGTHPPNADRIQTVQRVASGL